MTSTDCPPPDSGSAKQAVVLERIAALAGNDPLLRVDGIVAGYGQAEVLRGVSLRLGKAQSLCLVGPNGSGKSTVLNAIFGLADIRAGSIAVGARDVTRLSPDEKLRHAGIGYVMQESSIFPDMTVEENLWLGGYLMESPAQAKRAAERIFAGYPLLAARRRQPARSLSGGERRLLEIFRALMMEPALLLVDEPSIGLEPRYIEIVFQILHDLQHCQDTSIVVVEQNARKGLQFADIGCVLVAGEIAMAGTGDELLRDETIGRLFLGE